jgi:hypothetical protein
LQPPSTHKLLHLISLQAKFKDKQNRMQPKVLAEKLDANRAMSSEKNKTTTTYLKGDHPAGSNDLREDLAAEEVPETKEN